MQKSLFFFLVFFFGLFLLGENTAMATTTCHLNSGALGTCVKTCPSGTPFDPINFDCGTSAEEGGCCANSNGGGVCNHNGACDSGETVTNCSSDCQSGGGPRCGDGTCYGGETSTSCPSDCGSGGGGGGGTGVYIPASAGIGLSDATVMDVLVTLMDWLLGIAGIIAIIAFVISGIQYLVSAGNDSMIELAKKNMMYSIVGVIVMLSGLIIINAIDVWLSGSSVAF